jgi:hypothetical protein
MNNDKRTLIVPLLLITVGAGWLLTVAEILPGINWVWTLGLAGIGILVFPLAGVNKFSFVAGPFFILASVLSVLRQTGRLPLDYEVPLLVIVLGGLMLVARFPAIPMPEWVEQPAAEKTPSGRGVRLN